MYLGCREYMQELANPGTFPKPCEFGHEETADMFHGSAGAVGSKM